MKLLDHNCELFVSETNLNDEKNYLPLWVKKIRSWTRINKNHPSCKLYAISSDAVEKERKRHFQFEHWWIIHPYSQARLIKFLYIFCNIRTLISTSNSHSKLLNNYLIKKSIRPSIKFLFFCIIKA